MIHRKSIKHLQKPTHTLTDADYTELARLFIYNVRCDMRPYYDMYRIVTDFMRTETQEVQYAASRAVHAFNNGQQALMSKEHPFQGWTDQVESTIVHVARAFKEALKHAYVESASTEILASMHYNAKDSDGTTWRIDDPDGNERLFDTMRGQTVVPLTAVARAHRQGTSLPVYKWQVAGYQCESVHDEVRLQITWVAIEPPPQPPRPSQLAEA